MHLFGILAIGAMYSSMAATNSGPLVNHYAAGRLAVMMQRNRSAMLSNEAEVGMRLALDI